MRLAMSLNYSGNFKESVGRVQALEKVGLDIVWVAEAYSFDAVSQVGYLAALTNRVHIGTGIINVYSRTATAVAQTAAGGMLAIGDDLVGDAQAKILDLARPNTALYWGGMGARDKNFYNTIARRYGYEAEAIEIQDLYLDGKKDEAAAKVPTSFLAGSHLVGPASYIKERLGAFKEAGVTVLNVNPVGKDAVGQIEKLRGLVDDV